MKIYIVGVGLMGGSFALALRQKFEECTLYGIDNNHNNIEEALRLGLIDYVSELSSIHEADVVIISVPADAMQTTVIQVLDSIPPHTLVMDTGSLKLPICNAVSNHPKRKQFLAMHPICGTEFSGPKAAIQNLYKGSTMVLCETEKTSKKHTKQAMHLLKKIEVNLRFMSAEEHDNHIAYVSHLSHISSFILGKTIMEKEKDEKDIFDLAGSGFESTVRLAKSSPAMWTPIFLQNKVNVLNALNDYIGFLNHFKEHLENDNVKEIFTELKSINQIINVLNPQS